MWIERQTPVLTMELKDSLPTSLAPFEKLQDIIGTLVNLERGQVKKNVAEQGGDSLKQLPIAYEH